MLCSAAVSPFPFATFLSLPLLLSLSLVSLWHRVYFRVFHCFIHLLVSWGVSPAVDFPLYTRCSQPPAALPSASCRRRSPAVHLRHRIHVTWAAMSPEGRLCVPNLSVWLVFVFLALCVVFLTGLFFVSHLLSFLVIITIITIILTHLPHGDNCLSLIFLLPFISLYIRLPLTWIPVSSVSDLTVSVSFSFSSFLCKLFPLPLSVYIFFLFTTKT